ncbi:MAG: hypothetical protein IJ362_01405 [Oscillospiraceae bacterium]|nr:hypothetical protein [Oscillospiraceae bacterium]
MTKNKKLIAVVAAVFIAIATMYSLPYIIYPTYERRYTAGNTYVGQNQYNKAIKAYKVALSKDKTRPEGYGALLALYGNSYARDARKYEKTQAMALTGNANMDIVNTYKNAHIAYIQNDAVKLETADGVTFSYFDKEDRIFAEKEFRNSKTYQSKFYEYDENGNMVSLAIWGNNTDELYKEENIYVNNRLSEKIISSKEDGKNRYAYIYSTDGNLETVEKYDYDKPDSQYLKSVDYYENNILTKTQFIRNGYKQLNYESYYDEAGFEYKTVYPSYYILREKSESEEKTVLQERRYTSDNILTQQTETFTAKDKTVKTITTDYNTDGSLIKTTTTENDVVTVSRPTDNIINPRRLTQAEIDKANRLGGKLDYFIRSDYPYSVFETPQDYPLANLVLSLTDSSNMLTYRNKAEIAVLKKEGCYPYIDGVELDHDTAFRVPGNKVRTLLKEYLDITPQQLKETDGTYYSQRLDMYYITYRSDLTAPEFIGGVTGDNLLKLYTKNKTVTMKITDGQYYIVSVLSEDHSDLLPQDTQTTAPVTEPEKVETVESEPEIKDLFLESDMSKGKRYNDAMMAYNIYLSKNAGKSARTYGLYELTADNVPELIIPHEWGYLEIYTFYNGQLVSLETPPAGGGDGGCGILANGMVCGRMRKMEYVEYWFYTYNLDGSVKDKVNFSWNWYDLGDMEAPIFFYNDKRITRLEYISLVDRYLPLYEKYANIDYMGIYK